MSMTTARFRRRHTLLAFVCLPVVLVFAAVGIASESARPVVLQPVWLVSTRHVSDCDGSAAAAANLRYWRWTEADGWATSDAEDFRAAESPDVPTVVFVHGNDTDANEAVEKGFCVRDSIQSEACDRAFRHVIWSWPADRVLRRHRNDVPLKAARSDVESYQLAVWLNELRPGAKVGLVGHSFGPRIILGAMHLLAGGEVAGQTLSDETVAAWSGGKRNLVRATLLAAAEDADWLAPDGRHGRALSLIDETLVVHNPCDRILRWYPRLYGRGGPQAMGAIGPRGLSDADAGKVRTLDVAAMIGKSHDYQCYCSAVSRCGQWARVAFLDEGRLVDDR